MGSRTIAGLLGLVAAALVFSASAPAATVPDRIVSLSPTATEDMFAIGAGKQVVAVDSDSDYPPNAPHTKLSAYTPNAEAIAKYNPDLVVISNDEDNIVAQLGKLHIPVLTEPAATNLAGDYAQLLKLGHVTGHVAGAQQEVAKMKRQVAAVIASVPKSAKGMTFYLELSPDYYSATSTTFTGQALALLGLHDIADSAKGSGSGYPKLSAEFIVAADPQLIVLSDTVCCGETAAKVKARPGWGTIAAVQGNGVVGVNDDIASRWGPRIVDFMRIVADRVRAIAK